MAYSKLFLKINKKTQSIKKKKKLWYILGLCHRIFLEYYMAYFKLFLKKN